LQNSRYKTYYGYTYTPDADYAQGPDYFGFTLTQNEQIYRTTASFNFFDYRTPILANPGDQNGVEGDTPDLSLLATDPNNNLLTYSATGLPPGLSLDPIYGNLTGTIDYGDAANGPYVVTVIATNGGLSASQTFLWNVTRAAPSIDNADDAVWDGMNNAEGTSVSVPVIASDPDNLPLSYGATGLPAGLAIDPNSGIISGVVARGDDTGAAYDVVVSVSNGYKTTTLEFPWTIDKVALAGPADQTNTAGDSVNLAVGAQDLNGLALSYIASGLPDGLSIDPNSGVISGTVAGSGADGIPWQVTVDATDGVETSERTFHWTVLPSVIPALSLANPGPQVNATTDVISLPIQGSEPGAQDLQFSATGLPNGLGIDPATGIISGMDDDFSAPDGSVYTVTVTVTDDFGQTVSQSFGWQFNASNPGSSGSGSGGTSSSGSGSGGGGGGPGQASGQGFSNGAPGQSAPTMHPRTEPRDPAYFSVDAFWQNVEKLPGGIDAENYLLSQNGQVQWGWLLAFTRGRMETAADGTKIPVIHIAWTNNEAQAAAAFVNNIRSTWTTGFAAEFRIWKIQQDPIDPITWQSYIRERTQVMGSVVVAGAELYLSGLSIVSEGADWIVTINDIANADSASGAAIASISLLPFITSGTIKIVKNGVNIVDFGPSQRAIYNRFVELGNTPDSSVYKRLRAILDDYWKHAGGISVADATAFAKAEGFSFELGRASRFENSRNAVIIAKADLVDGQVNRILLAEEIQHGLDRATNQASRAIRRGITNEQFHAEVFRRIIGNYSTGKYQFLTQEDIAALLGFVTRLK